MLVFLYRDLYIIFDLKIAGTRNDRFILHWTAMVVNTWNVHFSLSISEKEQQQTLRVVVFDRPVWYNHKMFLMQTSFLQIIILFRL